MIIKKLLSFFMPKSPEVARAEAYREAIQEEAKVGAKVFGPVPEGTVREFFCLDDTTWVWHEEIKGADGKAKAQTTRYDVRPHGIFKTQNDQPYRPVSVDEARNLVAAIKKYNRLIDSELSRLIPDFGQR